MHGVHLQELGVRGQRVQNLDGFPAQVIASDAAQDCGMTAEPARHDGKICRRPTQSGSLRQHIPEQFSDSQNQMRFHRTYAPWLSLLRLLVRRRLSCQQKAFYLQGGFVNCIKS
jgi:hypothetical protein